MVIEYARNILGLKDAHSYEFRDEIKSENFVIKDMEDASNKTEGSS
jgi:CTP synthase (UTP-ammonia lyase)